MARRWAAAGAGVDEVTVELFAVLVASVAIAILLVVELQFPLGAPRRWLLQGRHVETTDNVHGPWFVVRDRERDGGHRSPAAAAAELSAGERVRAWLADIVSCPWCSGGWLSLGTLIAVAVDRGADVLWFWPALWFCSAAAAVVMRRVAEG